MDSQNISFKAANIRVAAISDTHGRIKRTGDFVAAAAKDSFFKVNKPDSEVNILSIVGDWFMKPGTKGIYKSFADPIGKIQAHFLKIMLDSFNNFRALYTPGNHCLEDGDALFLDLIKNIRMTPLISNAEKIDEYASSCIIDVKDDKNPEKVRQMLMLGVMPPNMDFYSPKSVSKIRVSDNIPVKDTDLTPENIKKTINSVSEKIKDFKQSHPESPVMLMVHSYSTLVDLLCESADIDCILQGHEHGGYQREYVNTKGKKTLVHNLSQNFKNFVKLNVHFDDDGKFSINSEVADIPVSSPDDIFVRLYNRIFLRDRQGIITIDGAPGFLKSNNVRYADNPIAKLVTDTVREKLNRQYPDVSMVAINTSTFRRDLPVGTPINNLMFTELFAGLSEKEGRLYIGQVSGADIIKTVFDNISENLLNELRNCLIAWSGLSFDKGKFAEELPKFCNPKNLSPREINLAKHLIRIPDKNGNYAPIDPGKFYEIAVTKKFFKRLPAYKSGIFSRNFSDTGTTALKTFLSAVEEKAANGETLKIPADKRV